MGTERADAVIVGAGLAGSAAARAMAGRGRSVVLVEAFQPGHRRGSSHGSARIFRRAYPDPLYVRLTGQAQVLWRQLSDEAGEELVVTTGAVDYGPARAQEKMYELLTEAGVPAELMKAEAAAERWPGMSFGGDPVMFHPDGGVLDPERAMTAMRGIAAARGAQIRYGSPVLRVEADDAGATVHTADRSWRAPVVIVAAGAWLEPLLGGQVPLPPLVVTQAQAFHFAPRAPGPWPVFIYHDEVARYGLPAGRDGEVPGAVKIGEHGLGTVTTGDGRDGIVSPAARDRVRAFARERLGGLDPAPVGEVTCLYTTTGSNDFILDRYGPFVVCSPCSGHGAKFAPLVGEIAADLACGVAAPDPRFTLAAHRGTGALRVVIIPECAPAGIRDESGAGVDGEPACRRPAEALESNEGSMGIVPALVREVRAGGSYAYDRAPGRTTGPDRSAVLGLPRPRTAPRTRSRPHHRGL
jgi:sarcosine oxidase